MQLVTALSAPQSSWEVGVCVRACWCFVCLAVCVRMRMFSLVHPSRIYCCCLAMRACVRVCYRVGPPLLLLPRCSPLVSMEMISKTY